MRIAMLVNNPMSHDARVEREASALTNAGHEVVVLAAPREDLPALEVRDGYRIRRILGRPVDSWRHPGKRLRQKSRLAAAALAVLDTEQPDVIHCHDSDTLRLGHRAAQRTDSMLVYDAHELFPDMLAGHGVNRTIVGYWRGLEHALVPRCDAVISVNAERAALLERRFRTTPVVIQNLPSLTPIARTGRLRKELGLDDDQFVILYQGVVNPLRGLDGLVEAVSDLPDVVLVIQGGGSHEDALHHRISELGVSDRVLMCGWIAPHHLHEYACDADCGVVSYAPSCLNNRLAAPNKLWSYMMAGIPVVASDLPSIRPVVEKNGIGSLFEPDNPGALREAIASMSGDADRGRAMGRRGRCLSETRYNWDVEAHELLRLYDRFADRPC